MIDKEMADFISKTIKEAVSEEFAKRDARQNEMKYQATCHGHVGSQCCCGPHGNNIPCPVHFRPYVFQRPGYYGPHGV